MSSRGGYSQASAAISSQRIARGLGDLGIACDEAHIDALHRYMGELALWNRKRDLVKAEGEELVVRHLLDSLAGLETVRGELDGRAKDTLFDLGSGGGFPGVPLAVFLPDIMVKLVERSARKCAFLRGVAAVVGLPNLEVVQAEYTAVENATADVVVFRALAPVNAELAGHLSSIVKPAGSVVAYKGRYDNAAVEAEAGGQCFAEAEVIPVTVPGLNEERSLVVLRSSRESF